MQTALKIFMATCNCYFSKMEIFRPLVSTAALSLVGVCLLIVDVLLNLNLKLHNSIVYSFTGSYFILYEGIFVFLAGNVAAWKTSS